MRYFAILTLTGVFLLGCGGGDSANTPTASGPPAGGSPPSPQPATPAPAPTAPVKPAPIDIAAARPVAKPSSRPRTPQRSLPAVDPVLKPYALLDPQGYELEEVSGQNEFLASVGPVDPTAFVTTKPIVSSRATPLVPEGLTAVPEAGVADDGFALRAISEKDGALMAYVPAGQYRQGNARGAENERPEHTAYLSAFYVDVQEVTVLRYMEFYEALRASRSRVDAPSNAEGDGQRPAIGVSFRDATGYAEWAGKSLPTESQWEKAARGAQSFDNVWGKGRPLWVRPRAPGQLSPVGSYPSDRSVYGVFDLAGNAREWCRDFWDAAVYTEAAAEPGGVARDWDGPRRPTRRNLRTVRGEADGWSVTARAGVSSAAKDDLIGFRCVLEFDPETVTPSRAPAFD